MPDRSQAHGGGWDSYLAGYHDANPGITEDVLEHARDGDGRTPYDWVVDAVPAGASTVIDLACGSGPVGRLIAARPGDGRRVVGIDRSAGELGRARRAAPSAPLLRASATALPIAGATADAVVVSMALMLLPLEAVLAEAARLLRPRGTLAATVPSRSSAVAGEATARPSGSDGEAFVELLRALDQGDTAYPEHLAADSLGDRFRASGLTLVADEGRIFTRLVADPDDATLVVGAFYAPGTDRARVADAVAGLRRRVRTAPVRVGYPIRRLVAIRPG